MRNLQGGVNLFLPFFERFTEHLIARFRAPEANRSLNHLQRIVAPPDRMAKQIPKGWFKLIACGCAKDIYDYAA